MTWFRSRYFPLEHADSADTRSYHRSRRRRAAAAIAIVVTVLTATFFLTMIVGNFHISPSGVLDILFMGGGSAGDRQVVVDIRLPRVLCSFLVGAALSASGLAMQSLFKNPMASPSVLGISSGAAFGASLAISFGIGGAALGYYAVPAMAFLFCFVTIGAVYLLARTRYGVASLTLLLSGIAVGAFFGGLVSLMQYVANEDVLASIVYWTMGSFNKCGWSAFGMAVVPIVAGALLIASRSRELNLISAGEEQASNMGVNIKSTRTLLFLGTSLCVGGSVAISGTIGFVGLIVPHVFRMLVGPDHKLLMPLCILGGASFMAAVDAVSKAVFAIPIPVGILTCLLGAPFFIYVMKTRRREMWE